MKKKITSGSVGLIIVYLMTYLSLSASGTDQEEVLVIGSAAPVFATEKKAKDEDSSQLQPVALEMQYVPLNWADIRIGMTKEEVRELLGRPNSEFPSPSQLVQPVAKSLLTLDKWWPQRFVMAIGLAFNRATYGGVKGYHDGWEYPRNPPTESYHVLFDVNGRVVRLSAPTDLDRQPLIEITEVPLGKLMSVWEETAGVSIEYDPLLVQNIMINIEGIEVPSMLEPRVLEACEQNGLQLSKVTINGKIVYTVIKKVPDNSFHD